MIISLLDYFVKIVEPKVSLIVMNIIIINKKIEIMFEFNNLIRSNLNKKTKKKTI